MKLAAAKKAMAALSKSMSKYKKGSKEYKASHTKKTMLKILDSYIDHIVTLNNKSLLVRIYGLFTIQSDYFSNLELLLMENTC